MANTRLILLMDEVNAGEEKRNLRRILGKQPVHFELMERFKDIERDSDNCKSIVYSNIYNFGVIQGKRAERAKRNNHQGG